MIPEGATVKIHYTLRVEGRVVDSSSDGEPLEYVQGAGQILPGLEEQLGAFRAGDHKLLRIGPDGGYGEFDPNAVARVPKEAFRDLDGIAVGVRVAGQQDGRRFQATITGIDDHNVTLDLNHPLAGKTLDFEIEVVDVRT